MKKVIVLSQQEIAKIIADYVVAQPGFIPSSEVNVRFEVKHNSFTDSELYCIVEGD